MIASSSSSALWIHPAEPFHLAESSTQHAASVAPRASRQYDSIDEDAGFPLATIATRESRHTDRFTVDMEGDLPPGYVEKDDSLPIYTPTYEPETLPMYLFKFGFRKCSSTLHRPTMK